MPPCVTGKRVFMHILNISKYGVLPLCYGPECPLFSNECTNHQVRCLDTILIDNYSSNELLVIIIGRILFFKPKSNTHLAHRAPSPFSLNTGQCRELLSSSI
jgi:hypothetical protein